jgi:hypothetical protein
MRLKFLSAVVCTTAFFIAQAQIQQHADMVQAFHHEALGKAFAYHKLVDLSTTVGPRLSGSEGCKKGVDWSIKTMREMGMDTVYTQHVLVPKWERGAPEKARIHIAQQPPISIAVAALGGSVATPIGGTRAQVVEITDFRQLEQLATKALKGKIVFFNIPMDPNFINTGFAYGQAVRQRWAGAIEAAPYGAVAVVIRSVTLALDNNPHTGSMSYKGAKDSIPAAAISTIAANQLSDLLRKHPNLELSLELHCKNLGMAPSHNVIGEIKGSVFPEELLVVGGHLDSWDLGDGSQDDGAGLAHSLEVANLFQKAGYRPKRTLRVVFFQNEEFGLEGGKIYAQQAVERAEQHYFAVESDMGSGIPRGFTFDTNDEYVEKLQVLVPYFTPYGIYEFKKGGSGADLSPLDKETILLAGLRPESQRYFDYHHSVLDNINSVHPRELALGAAAMASLVYLIDQLDLGFSKQ